MLKIGLGQGVLNFIEEKKDFSMWYNDTVCPMGSRKYIAQPVHELPPVDVMYSLMVKLGYSGERIIDELLALYHRYRNFKVDYLADSEITLGFIGYRGTGKSASVAKIIIEDYLLSGRNAWSNMPISVEVFYKDAHKLFETKPMPKLKLLEGDTEFRNGVMVLDEINMEVAESSRFMSSTNLDFTNQLQQIRKKGLDVIWSAQSWNTVDARVRWQSDYIIMCSCSKPENKGLYSYWRVMDSTGISGKLDFELEMRSHYLLDKVVMEGVAWIRPVWSAYDTRKLQGQESYNKRDLVSVNAKEISDSMPMADIKPPLQKPTDIFKARAIEYFEKLKENNIESIDKCEVYDYLRPLYNEIIGNNERHMNIIVGFSCEGAGYKGYPTRNGNKAYFKLIKDKVKA